MKPLYGILAALTISVGGCATNQSVSGPPVAPVRPVVDDYFGIKVTDPYRYMEKLDDPAVQAWFKGQGDYTTAQLAAIPERSAILADVEKYVNAATARVSSAARVNGRYFYIKTLASESLGKL